MDARFVTPAHVDTYEEQIQEDGKNALSVFRSKNRINYALQRQRFMV